MHPVEIICPRAKLREYSLDDLNDIFAYASDDLGSKFMTWPLSKVPDDSRPFLEGVIESAQAGERSQYELAIEIDGTVVGGCGLRVNPKQSHEAEMGYMIRRDLWGQGLMTEIAAALIGFGFDQLGLHRIAATHDPDNVGSRRVMEKLGMQYEGRLRAHLKSRSGEWRDSELRSILATDRRP